MVVKKLREQKHWSQEQLALLAGLSLRTIQRVEAGDSASLETLKSLASVFEINISKLTETITVIDKTTKEWKSVPTWISLSMLGVKTRSTSILIERLCALIGCVGLVCAFVYPPLTALLVFFASAYWTAICIRWIDSKHLW